MNVASGFDKERYGKTEATDERVRLHEAGLCDVSQIFGATGWRRRFRLAIQDRMSLDTSVPSRIQAGRSYTPDFARQSNEVSLVMV